MSHAPSASEPTREPVHGWHCSHLFYTFDRAALAQLPGAKIGEGREELMAALDPQGSHAPRRLQTSVVSGHKADFAVMMLDPDPLSLDSVHQRVMSSALGPAITPTYSFTSVTEVSEYVPTLEQYGARLVAEGEAAGSAAYEAKLNAYASRLEKMNEQRLRPELPPWPATCFYPMNKWRYPGANWFTQPASARHRMMTEHGRTGMQFAGKVTQLITVSFGFDDWEWGVTLWAANPEYLKDIVYRMRFDEASAKYAEFGPFYVSYIEPIENILEHCRLGG